MTTNEFFKWAKGKELDYDGVAGCQCVDLAKFYCAKKFSLKPGSWGNAIDWYTNYNNNATLKKYFRRLSSSTTPEHGDIVIWGMNTQYGHIAIVDKADKTNIYSYDCNWNGKACKRVKHSYDTYKGVLRPKFKVVTANLNVRKGVGTSYPVVDELDKGTLVSPTEYQNGWAKLADGKWVSNKYLD